MGAKTIRIEYVTVPVASRRMSQAMTLAAEYAALVARGDGPRAQQTREMIEACNVGEYVDGRYVLPVGVRARMAGEEQS